MVGLIALQVSQIAFHKQSHWKSEFFANSIHTIGHWSLVIGHWTLVIFVQQCIHVSLKHGCTAAHVLHFNKSRYCQL